MLKKYTLIIFLTFLVVFKSQSQSQTENYPVSATLVFAAPFSLKVSDYFTSNTRMYLNLNLKDLTKPTLKVYLKWSLEGPGIHIATRDGFIPTSFIELSKGTVSLQRGSDLSLYFQRGMLDYQGIDEGVVFNGSIPEGFYTMKFQALEAGSGREVSNLAESFFFVTSPQPPIINQPFNGSIVPVTNPQNVLLQWTPRQISTLESQVVYEVKVYEVAEGDDPVVVANSGILPFFTITQPNTSTFIGPSNKPLLEGFRYAMVVTAIDLNKKMNFVNDGRSEVSWFQYGQGCFAPSGLDVAEIAPGRVVLSWTPNTTAEGYVIEYKKKAETTWIVNGSLDNSYTINGLSPQTDYEFRVKTQCSGGKYSAYTATESVSVIGLVTPTPETEVSLEDVLDPFSQTVSTKNDGTPFDPKNIDELFALLKPPACAISGVSYVCGQTPSATPPVGEDLTILAKGDVLGIYDYAVLVTEVSNGSSPFTGKGLVKLPFAGNIKVPVEFKGIKAKKGEDGTRGGCVWYVPADLNEGYFQVKGSQQDAIVKEQEKLLADIYSELIDPQSFYGTFEEALAKYEAKRQEIQAIEDAGNKASKADYQELTKNLRGIVQGGNDWKEKLLKHFGSDANKPENKAILDKLDALKVALLACEKCVADNLSTTTPKTGGGGPMGFEDWEVNLAKCVYPDAKGVMDETIKLFTTEIDKHYVDNINKGDQLYSCKCGWLDYNHAFTPTRRTDAEQLGVGANNLWKQLVEESGNVSIFDSGGFLVKYTQDVKYFGFSIGTHGQYFVKYGLSNSEKKEIALTIFKEVSLKYESFQRINIFSTSSFEPSDLVSNLLSFYYFIEGYSKEKIENLCEVQSKEVSLEIYKKYPETFTDSKYKNRKFTPLYFKNKYCDENVIFPKEFQKINGATKSLDNTTKGVKFRDWQSYDQPTIKTKK